MKTLHVAMVGTAVALATGANAAILVLDHFEAGTPGQIVNTVGSSQIPSESTMVGSFWRQVTLEMQSVTPGDQVLSWSVVDSHGNFALSEAADGKVTIRYGFEAVGSLDPFALDPMNLDRSMYGLAGGVGVYIKGWNADSPVALTVTIDSNTEGTPLSYVWGTTLPLSLAELIVDGDDSGWIGAVDLTDIDYVTFEFDAVQAGDFKVDALGIPEPHEYAAVATLGLLGFAAFRRLQRRS
ncbi:MAG: hypothetical protein QHJ82_10285 [Verrucomicrobiota bacterium]|nr:hypothetical protein [Verrucomicrobiota bacterium]